MTDWKKGTPNTGRPRSNAFSGAPQRPAPTPPGRARSNAITGANAPSAMLPPAVADARAQKMIRDQQLGALREMFTGTKLVMGAWDGTWESLKTSKGLVTDFKGLVDLGKELGEGKGTVGAVGQAKDAKAFIKDMFGVKSITELKAVMPDGLYKRFTADVMPVVGTVLSGYDAVKKTADATIKTYGVTQMKRWGLSARGGDPAAAVRALHQKLKVSAASAGGDAALAATKFGTSAASLVGDGGTTANLTLGVIGLVKKLLEMALDFREMHLGNKLLLSPAPLDAGVFKVSPVLGCYMVVNANTSDIINILVEDMGRPGWMDRAEMMVKKDLKPMVRYATTIINESGISLTGIQGRRAPMQNKVDSRSFARKAFFAVAPKQQMRAQNKLDAFKADMASKFKRK